MKTYSTTQVSSIAGFNISADLIKGVGINPAVETGSGYYWDRKDIPKILLSIADNLLRKAMEISKEEIHDNRASI